MVFEYKYYEAPTSEEALQEMEEELISLEGFHAQLVQQEKILLILKQVLKQKELHSQMLVEHCLSNEIFFGRQPNNRV